MKVGGLLGNCKKVFEESWGQLCTGNGYAVRLIEKLQSCGAKLNKNKTISKELLDTAEISALKAEQEEYKEVG